MVVAHHQRERRTCGTCTLCCRVLAVVDIGKPAGAPCAHCAEGKGCRIYDSRPQECRLFSGLTYEAIKIKRVQAAELLRDA